MSKSLRGRSSRNAIQWAVPLAVLVGDLQAAYPARLEQPLKDQLNAKYTPVAQATASLESQWSEAQQLLQQGAQQYRNGQFQEALRLFEAALTLYQMPSIRSVYLQESRIREARTLNNIGLVYRAIGQPQRALEYFNQALPIRRETNDRAGETITLNNIGEVYRAIGQPQRALEYFNQALFIARKVNNLTGEAITLNNIGEAYRAIGQPQRALEYFNLALPIVREADNRAGEAAIFNNIGLIYDSIGQPQRALEYFNLALPIMQEVTDRAGEAATLNNIGLVYRAIGQSQRALEYFNRALPIRHEVNDRAGEATTLNNIGAVYDSIGQPQNALEYYTQALPIMQEVNNRTGEAITLNNIGEAYRTIEQPQRALEYFNLALPIMQEVTDRAGEAATLNNIGLVYRAIRQPQRALEYYNLALLIVREVNDRAGEATTLANIGAVYAAQDNPAQAIAFYQQSIAIIESMQGEIRLDDLKSSLASNWSNTYASLVKFLAEQGRFADAFDYAERAKARAFLDQLANGQIDFRLGANAALLQQEQDFRTQITAAQTQLTILKNRPQDQWDEAAIEETTARLNTLQGQYADLLTIIKLQSPATAALVTVDVAPLSEIQHLLELDATLINYFVTDERTFAFVITRNSFHTIPLAVSREELTEQIRLFRDFADLSDAHPAELQQLHQWLIAPLMPYLTTDRLIVVPHDVLHYLPFAALTDGTGYLSEDYLLSLLPSANTLRYLPQQHTATETTLLALGNPTIAAPLPPLRYAQAEVETIAPLFNTQPLVGRAATETAVLSNSGKSNILHLAVHGEYNPINPLFSTLYLAADSENDGRLEVHEIFGIDLTQATDLVVLSACETSIGNLSRGDEIVGLNRAFLYAGAPTVITSLWNVDDAPTGMLMEQFYTHLRNGVNPADALSQAQAAIRANPQYAHPYYWGAFSLAGRPR